ncbi:hypothetical protein BATDEDRAFT_37107 [Batrachochytrium dendrobatidis JAM81]|uniref:Oxidation resistance protein 1 n=1 Tax=Batrachochytrium dendrobatidis (strain JAM81 / FGSC 10211) TaxID=684364 RepID=F4P5N7_BATDJ|nr:uncharacterized protein BATDEDRAFT_37107 [Batrachochytrium dendrobatidis JAM81]EGF79218.1 hypothetical protein BATDEDRAFT_37107 [Batrachochytrium dendrobatidis JAM81]|eukprot:XP_006680020.1 hypothetical protein BATDEDRAFT_37107 [Batrachochytrium dendrobatidis JAM81]
MGQANSLSRTDDDFPPLLAARLRTLYDAINKKGESAFHELCWTAASVQCSCQPPSTHATGPELLGLYKALWIHLSNKTNKQLASYSLFSKKVAVLLHGSHYDKSEFIRESIALIPNLQSLLTALWSQGNGALAHCSSTIPLIKHTEPPSVSKPHSALAAFLLAKPRKVDASYSALNVNDDQLTYSDLADFTVWISQSRHVHALWDRALGDIFFSPDQQPPAKSRPTSTLLSNESCYVLDLAMRNSGLDLPDWSLSFSTKLHGQSWTIFLNAIIPPASSLIILRDRDGYIFGGFASMPWTTNPHFYGESSSFLFSISPKMEIYRSTGINTNHQYLNTGRQTLPNGLGFGGQIEFFGLWISNQFDHGNSMAKPISTTFGNPQLSKKEEFEIDFVEVWCVKQQDIDDRLVSTMEGKSSILDHTASAAMLEMAGKTMYAKTLHEPEISYD